MVARVRERRKINQQSCIFAPFNEATDIWKSVPVIAVITKSYSEFEKQSNVRMVREAFEAQHTRGPLDDLLHKPDFLLVRARKP